MAFEPTLDTDATSKRTSVISEEEVSSRIYSCRHSVVVIDREYNFDSLLTECLGEFGLFQKVFVSLLCLPACFFSAFHNFDMVFLAFSPDHHCKAESNDIVPAGRCALQRALNGSSTPTFGQNVSCNEWTYDTKHFDQTLVTEFNLVCNREIIIRNMISLIWLTDVFAVAFSYVQDKWGRKPAFILNLALVTAANLATLLATDFYWYTVLKCIGNLGCMFNICLCWSFEFVGFSKRTLVSTLLNFGYALATASMVICAYFGRTWRRLTLILNVPFLLVLAYSFWLPESPRWLFTHGKVDNCVKTLNRIACWNGKRVNEVDLKRTVEAWVGKCQKLANNGRSDEPDNAPKSVNRHLKEFLKNSNLRLKLILLTVTSSIGGQIFTAIPFNVENLPTDFLISFLIQSLVDLPAILVSMYVLDKFGRVRPLTLFTSLSGLICLLTWPFGHSAQWVSITLSSLARFFIGVTIPIAYQLANELYPTVVRGLGASLLEVVHSLISVSVQYILFSRIHWEPLPMVLMGSLTFASGLFVLFLPETKDQLLPDTIEEAESIGDVSCATFKLNLFHVFPSNNKNASTSESNITSTSSNGTSIVTDNRV